MAQIITTMDLIPISKQILQPTIKSNIQYVDSVEEMEKIELQPNEVCMRFDNNNTCFYIRSRDMMGNYMPIKIYFYEDFATKMQNIDNKEFIDKCKALKFDSLKTELAIKFFIENEKPMQVWEWLLKTKRADLEYDTVKNLRYKLKKALFEKVTKE